MISPINNVLIQKETKVKDIKSIRSTTKSKNQQTESPDIADLFDDL